MSRAEVARVSGMADKTLYNWIVKGRVPATGRISQIMDFARAVNADPEWLWSGEIYDSEMPEEIERKNVADYLNTQLAERDELVADRLSSIDRRLGKIESKLDQVLTPSRPVASDAASVVEAADALASGQDQPQRGRGRRTGS